MKNIVKKITAAAMAFTLLGAGTTFTNTVSPKTNALTASAATVDPNSPHNHGQYTKYVGTKTVKWQKGIKHYNKWSGTYHTDIMEITDVYDVWICRACGYEANRKLVSSTSKLIKSYC